VNGILDRVLQWQSEDSRPNADQLTRLESGTEANPKSPILEASPDQVERD
jgi:hypothetical protein